MEKSTIRDIHFESAEFLGDLLGVFLEFFLGVAFLGVAFFDVPAFDRLLLGFVSFLLEIAVTWQTSQGISWFIK